MAFFVFRTILIKEFLSRIVEGTGFADDDLEDMFAQVKSVVIYYFSKFVSLVDSPRRNGDGGLRKRVLTV